MDIHIKQDTRGENIYKFVLTFADGRQAFTHYIRNAGKPYWEFRCFMSDENVYKMDPDFYMIMEPAELWKYDFNGSLCKNYF